MHVTRLSFSGIFLLVLAAGCAKKVEKAAGAVVAQLQPVEVTTITRRDLAETLSIVGSVASNESATLRPEIAGLVRTISFEEGQPVKAGQLLVKLEDAELRALLAQSESRFQLTDLNLKRSEALRESLSNTQADVDRARTEFASAKSDIALLKVRLDRSEIKAPFDGIAGARTLSPGDYVTQQTIITTIDDLSRLKIDFQVPERFLAKVVPGTKFIVSARSAESGKPDAKLPGDVYFVSSSIDRATRSSQVKGYLSKAPASLRPGMFANVELVLSVKKDALTVAEGAILTTPRGTQIIAVRDQGADKVAEFVPVKLGLRAKGLVEVEAVQGKLDAEQSVVASGVGALILFPGAKLDPRPQKEQFRTGGNN